MRKLADQIDIRICIECASLSIELSPTGAHRCGKKLSEPEWEELGVKFFYKSLAEDISFLNWKDVVVKEATDRASRGVFNSGDIPYPQNCNPGEDSVGGVTTTTKHRLSVGGRSTCYLLPVVVLPITAF
jgi:hypothetical protein